MLEQAACRMPDSNEIAMPSLSRLSNLPFSVPSVFSVVMVPGLSRC
jgi:hypothetical protein